MNVITVEVLCAARSTVYRAIPTAQVRTRANTARLPLLGCPVVAHPPCRFWSRLFPLAAATLADMVAELRLGLWCACQVRRRGGVLEQPAHSRLWSAAALPMPSAPGQADSYSIAVDQSQWGAPFPKPTWLYFSGIPRRNLPPMPLSFAPPRIRTQALTTPGQRSATPLEFARWLCHVATSASAAPHPPFMEVSK